MDSGYADETKTKVLNIVRETYGKHATPDSKQFNYPTGRAGLTAQDYPDELVRKLPEKAIGRFCGVGNPFKLGPINPGEAVLDIGSGCGVDALCAAMMVGPSGRVVGVDVTPQMLDQARNNRRDGGLTNVGFEEGSGDNLMFPDDSFDVVISNGVFNLIFDKASAVAEVCRVLKPGGRFMIADEIRKGDSAEGCAANVDDWAG
ncbi:methyltransferase domain-containing protein [Thermodesulfobacteriota bacterium]